MRLPGQHAPNSCKVACRIIWPARVFNQCASTRPTRSSLTQSGMPYYLASTRVQSVCVYQASPLLMQSGLLFYLGRHACLNSVRMPGRQYTATQSMVAGILPKHVLANTSWQAVMLKQQHCQRAMQHKAWLRGFCPNMSWQIRRVGKNHICMVYIRYF